MVTISSYNDFQRAISHAHMSDRGYVFMKNGPAKVKVLWLPFYHLHPFLYTSGTWCDLQAYFVLQHILLNAITIESAKVR